MPRTGRRAARPPAEVALSSTLLDRLRSALRDPQPVSASDPRVGRGSASDEEAYAALTALLPEARDVQAAVGIAAAVTDETLTDLDRKHASVGAASELWWLTLILRGDVVQLGRLQMERRPDSLGHALHIPEGAGLDPAAVDASLERIRSFTGSTRFSCTSWLLDPVLVDELPASRIAAFAQRFTIVRPDHPSGESGADAVARFVFRRPLLEVLDPAAVVPRTALERLVAERLRSGRGWTQPVGVLRLPSPA